MVTFPGASVIGSISRGSRLLVSISTRLSAGPITGWNVFEMSSTTN